MKIIGVGCGPGLVTEQAIRELKKARIVYGSERAIELARPYLISTCSVKSIDDFKMLLILILPVLILAEYPPGGHEIQVRAVMFIRTLKVMRWIGHAICLPL